MIDLGILLIVIYALLGLHDRRSFKSAPGRDRAVYLAMLAFTIYLSADSLMGNGLFDLYSLVEAVFGQAARGVVRMLEVPLP